MLEIETIHHVSIPVTDLAGAERFYEDVLGLKKITRPDFPFGGAWYRAGDRDLHLIVPEPDDDPTLRGDKPIDSHDTHFAIRVRSYARALEHLRSKGYREDLPETDLLRLRANPTGKAGFPQIYILDPDRNVIEINAATLDETAQGASSGS